MSESQDEAMVRSIARECEQLVVGMFPYIPLDRVRWLLAYGERLRAELKDVAFQERCNKEMTAGFALEADRLRAENEKLQKESDESDEDYNSMKFRLSRVVDGSAAMQQELATLRATALTASEAMQIIVRLENGPNAFIPDKGVREKLDRIAHPEPQEGSDG